MSYWDRIAVARPVDKLAATVTGASAQICAPSAKIADTHLHWSSPPKAIAPKPYEIDLTGRRFGRMVVVGKYSNGAGKKLATWLVRCACGDYEVRRSKAINNPLNTEDKCAQCEFNRTLSKRGSSLTRMFA